MIDGKRIIELNDMVWYVGDIKEYNSDRGFGFIHCWHTGQSVFFHISNVKTPSISEEDFVIFKIGPSKKKLGKEAAYDLYLLSKYPGDQEFLSDLFSKYENKDFKVLILNMLTTGAVCNLVHNDLCKYPDVDNDSEFHDLCDILKLYKTNLKNKEKNFQVSNIISKWAFGVTNHNYRIRLWFEENVDFQLEEELITEYFCKSDNNIRIKILKRVDKQYKLKLLKGIFDSNNPQNILEFLLTYLQCANNFSSQDDVKRKIFNEPFWLDKIDYDVYQEILLYVKENITDHQTLTLFISGFIEDCSLEIIESSISSLRWEDIERVFGLISMPENSIVDILMNILNEKIKYYNSDATIPDRWLVFEGTAQDWMNYNDSTTEPFYWLSRIAKHYLSNKNYELFESKILKDTSAVIQIRLWENSFLSCSPHVAISHLLLYDPYGNFDSVIDGWLSKKIITKEAIIEILSSNLGQEKAIENRSDFYVIFKHIHKLTQYGIDVKNLKDTIPKKNLWFFILALWISDISSEFNFDEFKTKLVFLSPEHQIKFLRKIFGLAHYKEFVLTTEKLDHLVRIDFDIFKLNEKFNPEIRIDISVDIVIEAIKAFAAHGKFLVDSELLKIVYKDISKDKKQRFQVVELFDQCQGRFEADYNWHCNGKISKESFGENQFFFAIRFHPVKPKLGRLRYSDSDNFISTEVFEELKEKVKQLPGRKWNSEEYYWGVPSRYECEVLKFARENKLFINLEGSKYLNNKHLAFFERKAIPNGIRYCEGRLSNKKHQNLDRVFWWCCNSPCFNSCEVIHQSGEWEKYTLLDFLLILGFDLDDENRVGDYIGKSKYYQFISTINRFNRLLERLYCEKCGHILYPVEDSHFAHYRVLLFCCENEQCPEFKVEIYLHHCLNGRCNGIIDSRRSKKCPNGLYICDNEECGCCCSHDMLKRRLQNLETSGGYIHQNARDAVSNMIGHLEKAMHFCYKCGRLMEELGDEEFVCNDCGVKYYLAKNNFKRPHRHLAIEPFIPPPGFEFGFSNDDLY